MNKDYVILIFIDSDNKFLLIKNNNNWNFPIERKKNEDIIPFFTALRTFENTTGNRLEIDKIAKKPLIKIILQNINIHNYFIIIKSDQKITTNMSNFKFVSFTELDKIIINNKNTINLKYYSLIKNNIESIVNKNISLTSPKISINSPNNLIKTPKISIKSPNNLIKTPKISIKSPKISIKSPKISIKSPNNLIKSPNNLIKNPKISLQNLILLTKNYNN